MKLFLLFCFTLIGHLSQGYSEENSDAQIVTLMFTPPPGWRQAEKSSLPKQVAVMVVGQGLREFPPSMNLGYETFKGSIKDYMKIVRDINKSQGCILKDLGTIETQAGLATLSQFDEKTEWGEVRQMHAILIKDKVAYILTASALKDEFSKFYQEFFKAIQSLRITTEAAST